MYNVATPHYRATQFTPQGRQKPYCLSPHVLICPPLFSFPAIYNYEARGEEELSLQIGDTVHILEKYEGEIGLHRPHSVLCFVIFVFSHKSAI